MKQTAVDYIKEKLQGYGFDFGYVLDVAKEMEKEQISIAYKEGWNCPHGEGFPETGEHYYNETFKQTYESNT